MKTLLGILIAIIGAAAFFIAPYLLGCLIANERPFKDTGAYSLLWIVGIGISILIGIVIGVGYEIGKAL